MVVKKMKDGIYWVGVIDWGLRDFHGYATTRGGTYNSYLILDEKITLIDNVYYPFTKELLEGISSIVDPSKIDIIISNHGESDHSGSLVEIKKLAPHAKIYASYPNGVKILQATYPNLEVNPVKSMDVISIGKRTLRFIHTPMVHWPDNMVTYCEEDRILFSNDIFGQHIASVERFDEEIDLDVLQYETKKYFANIVLPYSNQVLKTLSELKKLDVEIVATSHGVAWKKYIPMAFKLYEEMATHKKTNKAVIIYDTMWGSTEKIAKAVLDAFIEANIPAVLYPIRKTAESDLMVELMEAKYIAVGSPTLNNGMLTSIASFLHYMKGLKPQNLRYFAFGSYGWGGQSPSLIDKELEAMGFERILDPVKQYFVPTEEELSNLKKQLIEKLTI